MRMDDTIYEDARASTAFKRLDAEWLHENGMAKIVPKIKLIPMPVGIPMSVEYADGRPDRKSLAVLARKGKPVALGSGMKPQALPEGWFETVKPALKGLPKEIRPGKIWHGASRSTRFRLRFVVAWAASKRRESMAGDFPLDPGAVKCIAKRSPAKVGLLEGIRKAPVAMLCAAAADAKTKSSDAMWSLVFDAVSWEGRAKRPVSAWDYEQAVLLLEYDAHSMIPLKHTVEAHSPPSPDGSGHPAMLVRPTAVGSPNLWAAGVLAVFQDGKTRRVVRCP